MSTWQSELASPGTIVGAIGFVVAIIIWWRKDAANPTQAASYSVVTASAEYAGGAFKVAQEAMAEAREANSRSLNAETRALNAEIANERCAATNEAFAGYCVELIQHIEHLGSVPPAPPARLVDWNLTESHEDRG